MMKEMKRISHKLLADVKQLIDDIKTGKVDVYEGFEQYRLDY